MLFVVKVWLCDPPPPVSVFTLPGVAAWLLLPLAVVDPDCFEYLWLWLPSELVDPVW